MVEAVSGVSDEIRFVAATTRSLSDEAKAFCAEHDIELRASFEEIIADPAIDAVVLVTPNSQHAAQTVAAAQSGKHVRRSVLDFRPARFTHLIRLPYRSRPDIEAGKPTVSVRPGIDADRMTVIAR